MKLSRIDNRIASESGICTMATTPNSNSHSSTKLGPDQQQSNGPTIRHIPIHVEGRDAPIINRNFPESTNPAAGVRASGSANHIHSNQHHPYQQQQPQANHSNIPTASSPQPPQSSGPNSIFSRVKNFPVRSGFDNEFFQGHSNNFGQRANSPGRSASPAAQVHRPYSAAAAAAASAATARAAAAANNQPQQYQNNNTASQAHPDVPDAGGPAAAAAGSNEQQARCAADESIKKIENIQRDVLALMDQVEQFRGTSKRDKQYLYLDEMLTQNLLKLDTIDTEGKESIKQARREAIKCINKCISALEAMVEAASAGGGGGRGQ